MPSAKRVPYSKWVKMSASAKAKKRAAINASKAISGSGSYKMRRRRIRGKGAYTYDNPGSFGKAGRWVGRALGSAFAGEGGGKVGEAIGGLAHYIGKIFGSGDYVSSPGVKENTILAPQIPSFRSGKTQCRINHREFLGDLYSSPTANTFDIQSFPINPGLNSTLPWLSQVCGATFQQYRINGMVFEFRSMSSDALNSTNTALGCVTMATDYDSADSPFTSKQQMENTEFGVSCKPSSNMIHAIECAPRLTTATELYIRAVDNPANTDIRLYDWGKFYVATSGCQGTSVNLGELWVSYDITLIKSIEQPPGYLIPVTYIETTPIGGSYNTNPYGNVTYQTNQIGVEIANPYIKFPVGLPHGSTYVVHYQWSGSSATCVSGAVTTGNGMSVTNVQVVNPASTCTTFQVVVYCQIDGPGTPDEPPYVAIGNGTYPATPTSGSIYISLVGAQTF